MRIADSRLKLGITCLLSLFLGQYAFQTTNAPLQTSSLFRIPESRFALESRTDFKCIRRRKLAVSTCQFETTTQQNDKTIDYGKSIWVNETSDTLQELSSNVIRGDNARASIPPLTRNMGGLQWLILVVCMMFAQFLPGKGFPTAAPPTTNPVLQSAVSATMLRTNAFPVNNRRSRNGFPQVVFSWRLWSALLLLWQFSQTIQSLAPMCGRTFAAFSGWYITQLARNPLITKCISASIIGLIGDAFAQYLEEQRRRRKDLQQQDASLSHSTTKARLLRKYDVRRGVSNVADSLFLSGPLLHFSYNVLESILPVAGASTGAAASLAALGQVLIDDVFLDAMFVAIMFVTTGLAEGYKVREISSQMKKDLVPAIRASWTTSVLLLPMEFAIFRFLPLSFRVLGMNLIDIIWEAMVSYMTHRSRTKGGPTTERDDDEHLTMTEHALSNALTAA